MSGTVRIDPKEAVEKAAELKRQRQETSERDGAAPEGPTGTALIDPAVAAAAHERAAGAPSSEPAAEVPESTTTPNPPPASRANLGPAVALGAVGCGAVAVLSALVGLVVWALWPAKAPVATASSAAPPAAAPPQENWTRVVPPITDEQRKHGAQECDPPDPMELGPYSPYQSLSMGRLIVPKKGAHTADMGYDVIIHFHGQDGARKYLVQYARGVAFVGIDKGLGSGVYSRAFQIPSTYPRLLKSITRALKKYTGDDRAHVRHAGLSCWSAGCGAVKQILTRHADRVDGIVALDGVHGGWQVQARRRPNKTYEDVYLRKIQPIVDFMGQATNDDGKPMVLTYSDIDPRQYPGTKPTALKALASLGLKPTPVTAAPHPYQQVTTLTRGNLHVWGFRGKDEDAHCAHLQHLVRAVTGILEPKWRTPAMDRDVEKTLLPPWAPSKKRQRQLGR